MSSQELSVSSAAAVSGRRGLHQLRALPFYPTLEHYRSLSFVYAAVFYGVLELGQAGDDYPGGSASGGVPAAWGFAVYRFRGKSFYHIYCAYASAFQVTMLSQYLVLDRVGVMNTHWAVILPAVFSTFPVSF